MKFLVAIAVLSSSVYSLAALGNSACIENRYSDSSWRLLSVEMQRTDLFPSKLPVLRLRRSEESSAGPIAVLPLSGDNSTVILDLEFKQGNSRTLAIMVEGAGIFVFQELVPTVQSIFTQNVVIGADQQKLEDLSRKLMRAATAQKLDSIQVWLNAMEVPESNELFRFNIGDQIISLPFYEVSSIDLERLTQQSDMDLLYSVPGAQTQLVSLKPKMSPVKNQGSTRGMLPVNSKPPLLP